ncbi:MAG: type II toxin-antitoxin system prevent-host-death family antitoxin [Deltaproteobacteria bacterium]|nr:type II toxin-antitoxin system prevent-host-death family antitoxin [Deltaproteobacteria bacterium]
MIQVGAYEAKTRLSQLLEQVAQGEEFVITRHGVPVAVLAPVPASRISDPKAAISALKLFRRGRRLAGISLRELIEAGRR